MRHYFILFLLLAVGVFYGFSSLYPTISMSGFSMNTVINLSIASDNTHLLHEAFSLLNSLDNNLSLFNPSSDLAAINNLAGKDKYFAPSTVLDAVNKAVELYHITHGTFNPLIGAVTSLWNINRNDNSIPSQLELDSALKLTDINNLVITDNYIFLKLHGSMLDLSGLAKGYASDVLAKFLHDRGVISGLIDLGGNVYALGYKPDGSDWRIGIRNPLQPRGNPALVLNVHDTAVITSGNYERYKLIDGKKFSHFFDPKTGQSINSDLLSVTIISHDGALADGLATAFMIMSFDDAKIILRELPDIGAVFITHYGIHATHNLKDIIDSSHNIISYF